MIEGCKRTLMCHPSRCLEDNSAESYVDYGDPVQEVLERTILAIGLETVPVIF